MKFLLSLVALVFPFITCPSLYSQEPLDRRIELLEGRFGKMEQKVDELNTKMDRLLSTMGGNSSQSSPAVSPSPAVQTSSGVTALEPETEDKNIVVKHGALLSAYELANGENVSTMKTGEDRLFQFVDSSDSFAKTTSSGTRQVRLLLNGHWAPCGKVICIPTKQRNTFSLSKVGDEMVT